MTETPDAPPPEPPPPNEYIKQSWKQAERAFDVQNKALEIHNRQIEAFAVLTIRSIALTCAGGIAAALGFYSANYDRLLQVAGALMALNSILSLLFSALIVTLLTSGLAYFSQLAYAAAIVQKKVAYEFPYVEDTKSSKRYTLLGDISRWGAVGGAVISTGFLVWAGGTFAGLVR